MDLSNFSLDPFTFFVGFITGIIFYWLMGRMRPLWSEIRENWVASREEAMARRSRGVEVYFRRLMLRRAQGMHLAAPLFALDEILEPPRLLAPPSRVEPGYPHQTDDIVTKTVPYTPAWPELAGYYRAPTLSLPEALSGGMNLVITGQPGTGKTVMLAHLASLMVNQDPSLGELSERIPCYIHVADIGLPISEPKNLLVPFVEAASAQASVMDLARLPNFIEFAFSSGRAFLLLDGFDELSPSEQAEISNYLKMLLGAYPKIQAVTTGCPEHLDGLVALGFVPLSIMPWQEKQQQGFIEKWGQLWMQNVALEAWAQTLPEQIDPLLLNSWLNNDNQLLTPLELTLKIWAAYVGDSLGASPLDFIAAHVRRLTPTGTPIAALESLGMQSILASQPVFDPRNARDWVKKFELVEETAAPDASPEESDSDRAKSGTGPLASKGKTGPLGQKSAPVQATSGLLGKMTGSGLLTTHQNNRLRFVHPIFSGFLAGKSLADYNAEPLLQQPDWAGKLLALRYLAAYGDPTRLVNALLQESDLPLLQPLFVTARWLRDAPKDAPWRGKIFTQLASVLQTEGIPLGLRAQTVTAFAWSGDPAVQTLFRQFLRFNSFELVQLAALGCGVVKDIKAVQQLSEVLYAPSVSAQRAGCLALVAIGTSEAMEATARALLHGEEDLRRAAAEALANDSAEGHAMLKEGMTLTDILLRRAVIFGLARVEEEWATEALQRMQVEDEQWVVRNAANEVLESKSIKSPRIPTPLTTPSETPWLIEFAGKQGVGISPGSAATEILLAALKSEIEEERLAALPYLQKTPSEGVITNLFHAMYSDHPELREAVFIVLCQIAAGGIKLPQPQQFGLA